MVKYNKTDFCIFITKKKTTLKNCCISANEEIEKLSGIKKIERRICCVLHNCNFTRRMYIVLLPCDSLKNIFVLINYFSFVRLALVLFAKAFDLYATINWPLIFFCCSVSVVECSFRFVIRCVDPSANIKE